jgi:two-component system, OmpR family, response regulator
MLSVDRMPSVLVIDDEQRIASFVTRALTAHGLDADAATDPAQARDLAIGGDHDLLVLDLLMPEVSGLGVLRASMRARPDRPVMILSATADVDAKVRCLQLGATDYMTKPFAVAELVARVWAHLRAARAAAPRATGPLALAPDRRTADAGGGPVQLTPREYQLLRHLCDRPGHVCTREEILADAWACPFDPGTNVVAVCVGRLRAKLGDDVIETVRSAGYCVAAG